jgi:hypothetical protein
MKISKCERKEKKIEQTDIPMKCDENQPKKYL